MIRQRLRGQPACTRFVCAFCRSRSLPSAPRGDSSSFARSAAASRWNSSSAEAAAQSRDDDRHRDVPAPAPRIGLGLAGFGGFGTRTVAKGAGFGRTVATSPATPGGARSLADHGGDFLLPHEQAARGSAPRAKPPPTPATPAPFERPRPQSTSAFGEKRSRWLRDDNEFLLPHEVAARGRAPQPPPPSRRRFERPPGEPAPTSKFGSTKPSGSSRPFSGDKARSLEPEEWTQLPRRNIPDALGSHGSAGLFRKDSAQRDAMPRSPPKNASGSASGVSSQEFLSNIKQRLAEIPSVRPQSQSQTLNGESRISESRTKSFPNEGEDKSSEDSTAAFMAKFSGVKLNQALDTPAASSTKPQEPSGDNWNWIEEEQQELRKVSSTTLSSSSSARPRYNSDVTAQPAPRLPSDYDTVNDRPNRSKRRQEKVAQYPKPKRKVGGRAGRHNEDDDYYEDDWGNFDHVDKMGADRRQRRQEEKNAAQIEAQLAREAAAKRIMLPQFITVASLGEALRVHERKFLADLGELGFEDITLESVMTGETAALVAQEYGFEPTVDTGASVDLVPRPPPEDLSAVPPRPPIVTIMGHVDHGKTTMLDWLRKSSIAAGEHGGITQHIGAFSVRMPTGKQITFLDTPGHAAFLTMRKRGADITDIVILVVAADDSVKPQTLEALRHARAAKVPIIVAINKADKPEARVDQVKIDLANNGIEIEDHGGDVQVVPVSGKTGMGMDLLEENIVLLSEVLDMRAEADGMVEGWVVESSIKPIGRVATVLVKRGTLRKGDVVVAGTALAKVRAMLDENGRELEEAPPGTPVEVLGWRDAPSAGDMLLQAPDESVAREAIRYREDMIDWQKTAAEVAAQEQRNRDKEAAEAEKIAEEYWGAGRQQDAAGSDAEDAGAVAGADADADRPAYRGGRMRKKDIKVVTSRHGVVEQAHVAAAVASGPKVVNFNVKGDVMGSVEAVTASILEIGNHEVSARVLRSSPGQITASDIEHAATTGTVVVNFNNPIPPTIQRMAELEGVRILDHTVIYHLTDEVREVLSERLPEAVSCKVLGEAEVLQVFPINVRGRVMQNIAGCKVRNGQLLRGNLYRVLRRGEKVFDGKITSLKSHKKDVMEIKKGSECGIAFEDWEGFEVGDQLQAYEEIREKRHL